MNSPALRLCLLSAVVLCASACSSVKPWVKPYERDRIADPIMSWDRMQFPARISTHIYESAKVRGASPARPAVAAAATEPHAHRATVWMVDAGAGGSGACGCFAG